MLIEQTVRQTKTGPTIGYMMIADGWYKLDGSTFKYNYDYGLFYFGGENSKLYVPKNELRPGIADFFRIPTGKLTFSTDRSRFQFQEDCFEVDPQSDCISVTLIEYLRVN
ncbi:MAG: hypothetical protein ACI9UV_002081 [Algoriphagus sp.]|jgi:hypothetical protein